MTKCQEILKQIGYPTNVIILDFETVYSAKYHMGSGGLSTPEYIMDEQFDFLGMACLLPTGLVYYTPNELLGLTATIQRWCKTCTIVGHNMAFDGLILAEKFGAVSKYCIDTIGLSRFFEARAKHSLEECAKRYGLQPKGELAFAKGKHWKDLTPPLRKQLIAYAKNDVEITVQMFEIMLPMLPRPEKELVIMQDLLNRAWVPQLVFDFEKAEKLKGEMEEQITNKLLEIDWL